MIGPQRRNALLLRCYPRSWRDRYGEEFAALLDDDIAEHPRSLRRDIDVARAGLQVRFETAGLLQGPLRDQSRVALVATGAATMFLAAAVSIWTQLADGRLTSQPDTARARIGLIGLSIWLVAALLAAATAGLRVAIAAARAVRRGRALHLLPPMALLVASAAVLDAGVRLMAGRWPGARSTHHHGLFAAAARLGWASTDTISTFWLHPHRLLSLPVGELAWMAVCPAALLAFGWSVVRIAQVSGVRTRERSSTASLVGFAALPGIVPAAAWVIGSQHAANASYRAGTLDLALLLVMATAAYLLRNCRYVSKIGGRGGS